MKYKLFLTLFLVSFSFLNAQSGLLDLTFDQDGIVSTKIGIGEDVPRAVAVQTDGKIIAAGYTTDSLNHFCLVRYHVDGAIDSTFGTDGVVITRFPSGGSLGYTLALQTDGKILLGGSANPGFALARYLTDGSPDTAFGTMGRVTTSIQGLSAVAQSMAIQPDGKIVLGGYANNSFVDGAAFAVVRYLPDGNLDTGFANGGVAITDIIPGSGLGAVDQLRALDVQADGKIVGVGFAANHIVLVRYRTDGTLDPAFGNAGIVAPMTQGLLEAVVIQADGKIVAAGFRTGGYSDFMLVRLDSTGTLDNSFGTGGVVYSALSATQDAAAAILLQPDQKLVVGGVAVKDSIQQFALARYETNGNLDMSFGTNGVVQTKADSSYSAIHAMAFQPDGKIVVAGTGYWGAGSDFTLARYTSGTVNIDDGGIDALAVSIYPNPASEKVNMTYELKQPGTVSVTMRNSLGQTVHAFTHAFRKPVRLRESLPVAHLPAGLYFIQLSTPEGSQTFKLIKE